MVAMPELGHLNPWKNHFAQLALGFPPGHHLAHDAFRQGLLSLSAFDLGYRIAVSSGVTRADVHLNPVVQTSEGLRAEASKLLDLLAVQNGLLDDHLGCDLAVGTCVSLLFRDVSLFSVEFMGRRDGLTNVVYIVPVVCTASGLFSKMDTTNDLCDGPHQTSWGADGLLPTKLFTHSEVHTRANGYCRCSW